MAENETDMTRGTYRAVYSNFITGRKICSVSIEAEAWFWRLQAIADDFGNLPGDVLLVWQRTVGRRDVSMQRVEKWVNELVSANLLSPYTCDGEPYLHITYWSDEAWLKPKNGKRAKRFPSPQDGEVSPGVSGCLQVFPGVSGANKTNQTKSEPKPKQTRGEVGFSDSFIRFWNAYPGQSGRKQDKAGCFDVWKRDGLEAIAERIVADVEAKKRGTKWTNEGGKYIEGPIVYLRGKRWLDTTEGDLATTQATDWKPAYLALPKETQDAWRLEFQVANKHRDVKPGEFGQWIAERMRQENAA